MNMSCRATAVITNNFKKCNNVINVELHVCTAVPSTFNLECTYAFDFYEDGTYDFDSSDS